MCKILEENSKDSVEAYLAYKPISFQLRKNLHPLEGIYQNISRLLSPAEGDQQPDAVGPGSPSVPRGDEQSSLATDTLVLDADVATDTRVPKTESGLEMEASKEPELSLEKEKNDSPKTDEATATTTSSSNGAGDDVEMEEAADSDTDAAADGDGVKRGAAVIVLE